MSEKRAGEREGESAVMQASRELTEAGRLFEVAAMRSAMAVVWKGLGSAERADAASFEASLAVARATRCVERYAELMGMTASLPGPALAGRLDALGSHADAGPVEVDADDDGRGEGLAALGAVEWARVTVGDGAAVTAEQERGECGHAVDARTDGGDEAGTAGARGARGEEA